MEPQPVRKEELFVFHEDEAQIIFKYNGKVLREGTTSGGCGGGGCIDSAIDMAQHIIADYGIKKEDPLTLEIEYRVHEVTKKKRLDPPLWSDGYDYLGRSSDPIIKEIVWTNREGRINHADNRLVAKIVTDKK